MRGPEHERREGETSECEETRRLRKDARRAAEGREYQEEARVERRPEDDGRQSRRGGDGDVCHPGRRLRREDRRGEKHENGQRGQEGALRGLRGQSAREQPDGDDEDDREPEGEHTTCDSSSVTKRQTRPCGT